MTLRPSSAPRAVTTAGALFSLLLSLALASSGCKHGYSNSTDPEGVGATSALVAPQLLDASAALRTGRLLIPLAVGNRWEYHNRFRYAVTTPDGPQPPETFENPWVAEITGTAHIGERDYFLQSEGDPHEAHVGDPFRVRQDRSGLFELDPPDAVARPADAAADAFATEFSAYVDRAVQDAGQREAFRHAAASVAAKVAAIRSAMAGAPQAGAGADPGEITMLRYPLSVGARWIVRDSPRFARVVVARERVQVPLRTFVAWKVRGTSELFGPDDRVFFWYSSAGLLRFRYHVVGEATDTFGNVIGTAVSDFDQSLTGLRLMA